MKIRIVHYTKKIGQATVLDDINMELTDGKIYGLKGKNGAGKTMLMRAVSGLIRPTEGYVEINDKRLGSDISFPEDMGILLENPGFIADYSGMDNLKILAGIKRVIGEKEIAETMEKVGLDPYEKKKYRKYSLGMKQKLGIAAALMENPKLIILGEPVNALDEESIKRFQGLLEELKSKNKIVILSCHDSEELYRFSDEIFYMENGKIKEHIDLIDEGNKDEGL